ncbi:MAG TPA: hypothetical protein VMF06_19825 [Candidatus Limnocylindria bacterium]|nr:hypothetical protein [Candidatus Limnocylindria bacterium]
MSEIRGRWFCFGQKAAPKGGNGSHEKGGDLRVTVSGGYHGQLLANVNHGGRCVATEGDEVDVRGGTLGSFSAF